MRKKERIWVDKAFYTELKFVIKSLRETEKKKKKNRKTIGNIEGTRQIAKYLNSLRNMNM